jgi:hypothetical protein
MAGVRSSGRLACKYRFMRLAERGFVERME